VQAAPTAPSRTSPVVIMATFGAAVSVFTIWVWVRWITSADFRPVDTGADPIPTHELVQLRGLELVGLSATLFLYWRYLITPWRRAGRITTDGLILLALPMGWFWDPWMNYSQNWFVYNGHLFNLGSWTSHAPTFVAANQNQFAEPLLVGFAYVFWVFPCMLLGGRVMDWARTRRPGISTAGVITGGGLACIVMDGSIEFIAVRLGFYAMPGAWPHLLLFGGTRWQFPITEAVFGGIGTFAWVVIRYFKDDRGYTLSERGVDRLRISERGRTVTRYLAIVGGLAVAIAVFNILCQFQGLHSGLWPQDTPSYLSTTCPELHTDRAACGGPGLPIPRNDRP
jgi:hypothetical protein